MHTADWNPTLSEYVKADTHNAERLLTVFEHRTESRPPVSLLILYIPPSSTLTQFTSFLTDTFTHLATFQTRTNMAPIILTDANAHCNSGGDDLRQFNIPNRTKPYAHRHTTGHKKNASQTPPAKRGDILEISHSPKQLLYTERPSARGEPSSNLHSQQPQHSHRLHHCSDFTIPRCRCI